MQFEFLFFLILVMGTIGAVVAAVLLGRIGRLESRIREVERRASRSSPPESHPLPGTLTRSAAPRSAPTDPPAQDAPRAPEPSTLDPLALETSAESEQEATAPALDEAFFDLAPPKRRKLPSLKEIEWERWLGIRGAAILGGVALVIAGLFFFQYAVQHGWFGPELRVATGALVGIACLFAKEPLQKRGYRATGDVLAGAGTVLLYGAAWAGYRLYDFFPLWIAFVWMSAVTAVVCVLSVRHDSQIIALFGLVGGFATPLLLSSAEDRPIGLFGYVLLLDLALLALGRRQSWRLLPTLALVGTTLMQGLWIFGRMGEETAPIGLGVLAVFGLLFALESEQREPGKRNALQGTWIFLHQLASLALPLVFAVYFAVRVDLGPHLYPVGLLLAALIAAASWIGARRNEPRLPLAIALGAVGIICTSLRHEIAWEIGGVAAGVALVALAFTRLSRQRTELAHAPAAILALGGLVALAVTASDATRGIELAPYACGAGALLAIAALACTGRLAPLLSIGGLFAGVTAGLYAERHLAIGIHGAVPDTAAGLAPWTLFAALPPVALLTLALLRKAHPGARHAALAAAAFALPALVGLPTWGESDPTQYCAIVLLLVALAMCGAAASGFGAAVLVTVLLGAFAGQRWLPAHSDVEALGSRLLWQSAVASVLTLTPFLFRKESRSSPLALRAAALSPMLFVGMVLRWWEDRGLQGVWIVPLGLAALSGLGFWLERRTRGDSPPAAGRYSFAAYGTCLAVIALFIAGQTLPFGFLVLAGTGLAWAYLAHRTDHAWFARGGRVLFLICAVFLTLAALGGAWERTDARLFNEISYAYLVPALCMGAGIRVLQRFPARVWFRSLIGLSLVVVVFTWLNLEVTNAYGEGRFVRFQPGRVPARDLAQSIAWLSYAFVLLMLGTWRKVDGLRKLSLGFFLISIAKVFLFDLGELEGLYRVASFMGLAVCLLVVSVLYQRFVFRAPVSDTPPGT